MARNAQEPLSGPLRFGVIPTIGPYVLPSLLPRLGTALPRLQLYVREDRTAVLLDKLAAGELDILLLAMPYDLGDIEVMAIADDPIVVAMSRNHPLCRRNQVDRDDLAQQQLLMMEDGHCLRTHSLQACQIVDPVRNETFQATTLRTLVQMVAAGLGITLMPRIAVEVGTCFDARRRDPAARTGATVPDPGAGVAANILARRRIQRRSGTLSARA